MSKKNTQGITVRKDEDLSEWYTQVIQKAELIEYSPVSGCYILRPNAYHIWEKVQSYFDALIKQDGVQNSYFPLFIPESLLIKEKNHVEGFAPEVAWVESGGHSQLGERLAIRPTSETIIYDAYSKWIRSHKDLPLRLNQWCNVVRWEFKHCTPFLRSREFLWQEGHTAFATKEEAIQEAEKMLHFYEQTFKELYALPIVKGVKSEAEKFAGADFTLSAEVILPSGKAIQGATSHHLGQNFAQAFDIAFTDELGKKQYVWQNSWGLSTRSIGVMILMHSDDKGLVLPPKVAATPVVIVPILFDDSRKKILKTAADLKKKLQSKKIIAYLDDRDDYSPGWKFNEWEVKGVPIRIEIGPKDAAKKSVIIVRRDTGEKMECNLSNVAVTVSKLLETIQLSLYQKAEKLLKEKVVTVKNFKEADTEIKRNNVVYAQWCGAVKCEEEFRTKTGAKSLNSPLKQSPVTGLCFACKNKAKSWFYFGKSY